MSEASACSPLSSFVRPRVWLALSLALVAAACSEPTTRVAKAVITVTPASVDFGTQAPNAVTKLSLTIANDGAAALIVSGSELKNDARGAFKVGALPPSVAAGTSAVVEISYTAPALPGSDQATLVINSNSDTGGATSVPLLGKSGDAACTDKLKNGDESDVDCGGEKCPGCTLHSHCASASDCAEGLGCGGGQCSACSDSAQCRTGQLCKDGLCSGCAGDAECPAGSTCETGACRVCPGATGAVDTKTDARNCGRCGNACPVPLHAGAVCLAGACGRSPCAPGYYDLGGSFGCESSCVAHVCTDDQGHTVTITNTPLPEVGNVFQSLSSGSSLGSNVQTSRRFTNTAVLGESTPPALNGAAGQQSTHFRNTGGVNAVLH